MMYFCVAQFVPCHRLQTENRSCPYAGTDFSNHSERCVFHLKLPLGSGAQPRYLLISPFHFNFLFFTKNMLQKQPGIPPTKTFLLVAANGSNQQF